MRAHSPMEQSSQLPAVPLPQHASHAPEIISFIRCSSNVKFDISSKNVLKHPMFWKFNRSATNVRIDGLISEPERRLYSDLFDKDMADIEPDLAVTHKKRRYLMCVTKITETGSVKSLGFSRAVEIKNEHGERTAHLLNSIDQSKLAEIIKSKLSAIQETMKTEGKTDILEQMAIGNKIPDSALSSKEEELLALVFMQGTKRKEDISRRAHQALTNG